MKPAEPVMSRVLALLRVGIKYKFEKENAGCHLTLSFNQFLVIFLPIRNNQYR